MNPRYVVTSQAGDRENRIKEMKLGMGSGRTSGHRFRTNRVRLSLTTAARALMASFRKLRRAAAGPRRKRRPCACACRRRGLRS
ncbi:MAG: transposase [Armatimonadetes bacterium]|nr:transposase [Armatimonadota bacterium]